MLWLLRRERIVPKVPHYKACCSEMPLMKVPSALVLTRVSRNHAFNGNEVWTASGDNDDQTNVFGTIFPDLYKLYTKPLHVVRIEFFTSRCLAMSLDARTAG